MRMLKRIVACLLIATVSVTYASEFELLRQGTKLVVSTQFDLDKPNREYESGSGVVIAPGYVLTARHVVEDNGYTVFAGDSIATRKKAVIVKMSDEKTDLALLYVPDIKCPCVQVADQNPDVDTDIVHVGFPLYPYIRTQYLNHGAIQGYAGKDNYSVYTNAQIAPGSSGGAFYVKTLSGWKLAALSVAVIHLPKVEQLVTWMSIGVSASAIRVFLKGTPAEQ